MHPGDDANARIVSVRLFANLPNFVGGGQHRLVNNLGRDQRRAVQCLHDLLRMDADLLVSDLSTEDLVRVVDRFLMYYIRTADRLQRTAAWVEAMDGGLDHLRSVIIDDSLGIAAELDAAMARHVETYADEWRSTLADPDRMRRFVSFVNAPEVPDPSIAFTTERDQPVPVFVGLPTPTAGLLTAEPAVAR